MTTQAPWQRDKAFLAYLGAVLSEVTELELATARPDGPFVQTLGIDQRYQDFRAGRRAEAKVDPNDPMRAAKTNAHCDGKPDREVAFCEGARWHGNVLRKNADHGV
jgi:hypothetical protein